MSVDGANAFVAAYQKQLLPNWHSRNFEFVRQGNLVECRTGFGLHPSNAFAKPLMNHQHTALLSWRRGRNFVFRTILLKR